MSTTQQMSDATLPRLENELWFLFHGDVKTGRVVRVARPGQRLAYATAQVATDSGFTCLHGANPAVLGDIDGWYSSATDCQGPADLAKTA